MDGMTQTLVSPGLSGCLKTWFGRANILVTSKGLALQVVVREIPVLFQLLIQQYLPGACSGTGAMLSAREMAANKVILERDSNHWQPCNQALTFLFKDKCHF